MGANLQNIFISAPDVKTTPINHLVNVISFIVDPHDTFIYHCLSNRNIDIQIDQSIRKLINQISIFRINVIGRSKQTSAGYY